MNKLSNLAIGVVFVAVITILCYLASVWPRPLIIPSPDHVTTIIREQERYHIIPESQLAEATNAIMILDKEGNRYYILSEEKLRLLGPKLLIGDE